MSTDYQIVFCTCPDKDIAEKIASLLVENKVAACVNIVPNITSIYRWQGQLERAEEVLLLIKARQDTYSALESLIKKHHPYQLPEIIAVAIERGLPDYLNWIASCH
ncbi:MAG: periplasmic divalent cation tolerance protein [Methylococcaceae bacterium NSP1-2]|nr:divalent-cation tolerance protein CutA [Methylococcaceae bacterium]OYV15390.1 MAG: periplasmic divalent cation tolerance protein [Methylococcaceae bacterium NSP1-2]